MIRLKNLIKIQEASPTPSPEGETVPPAQDTAVVAAKTTPTPDPTSAAPEPAAAGTGDYDFTKDFKEFEDSVNKAKADAKKKFLDKMNASVVGKKVTVNASRGYGQPQKDYTIDNVSKASVDWYYNKNVVVLSDANGKEYFLTPGVNIKIEAAGAPEQPDKPESPVPSAAPSKPEGPEPSPAPAPAQTQSPDEPTPPSPAPEPEPEPSTAAVAVKKPAELPGQENPDDEENKKLGESKKTKTIKELKLALEEFLVNESLNLSPFIKGPKTSVNESKNRVLEFIMEIPKKEFKNNVDLKEMKLNLVNGLRNHNQPSKNIVEIESIGRNYLFTITKELV